MASKNVANQGRVGEEEEARPLRSQRRPLWEALPAPLPHALSSTEPPASSERGRPLLAASAV